jgi:hypothetical protein
VVIAGFEHDEHGGFGCIVIGERRYEIVRDEPRGWHFRLLETDSRTETCEFARFRLRRGGKLTAREQVVTLRGRPLSPDRWTFASDAGWQIKAHSRPVGELTLAHAGRMQLTMGQIAGAVEVRLGGAEVAIFGSSALLLAFGCWILVEWESVPVAPRDIGSGIALGSPPDMG